MLYRRSIINTLLLLSSLVSVSCSNDEPIDSVTTPNTTFDIPDYKLIATLPSPERAVRVAAILLPGGGYSSANSKTMSEQWNGFLANKGIAAFSLGYTLPQGNFKLPVDDVLNAYNYIVANASQFNINPDSIGIIGFSAGGHLASLMATAYSTQMPLNFQVLFYPVISMEDGLTHQTSRLNFLGDNPTNQQKLEFSTYRLVNQSTPRALIFANENDVIVPIENSYLYSDALEKHNIECKLCIFPGTSHGWSLHDAPDISKIEEMLKWIIY